MLSATLASAAGAVFSRVKVKAWLLLLPPLVTAAATLAAAAWADAPLSPLAWARLIAAREYLGLETP